METYSKGYIFLNLTFCGNLTLMFISQSPRHPVMKLRSIAQVNLFFSNIQRWVTVWYTDTTLILWLCHSQVSKPLNTNIYPPS